MFYQTKDVMKVFAQLFSNFIFNPQFINLSSLMKHVPTNKRRYESFCPAFFKKLERIKRESKKHGT